MCFFVIFPQTQSVENRMKKKYKQYPKMCRKFIKKCTVYIFNTQASDYAYQRYAQSCTSVYKKYIPCTFVHIKFSFLIYYNICSYRNIRMNPVYILLKHPDTSCRRRSAYGRVGHIATRTHRLVVNGITII